MKKIFVFFAICALLLSGCGPKDRPAMDQEAEDGKFHYQNKDLGFSIVLPGEFKYYQTQRIEDEGFKDIEFFVPTSDLRFGNEVPGYAKPIVVRVFEKNAWENTSNEVGGRVIYEKKGEKKDSVYTIKFWENIPTNWENSWNNEMRTAIFESFTIL